MLRRRRFRWTLSKINAQATRAESAQMVLAETTVQATPETDREPALGGVTTSSKFKAQKFWRGGMRPPAPVQLGGARGALARSSAAIYG